MTPVQLARYVLQINSVFILTEFCHRDDGGNMLEVTYHLTYCKNPENHHFVLHTVHTVT
jgi:hypothetical protein